MNRVARLDEVCSKESSNVSQKDLIEIDGEYKIFGASGYIQNVNFYHQDNEYIAIVKDGSGVGRVMLLPEKSSIIGTLQYIIPNSNIDVRFLYYKLRELNLSRYANGAAIPHIYFRDYKNEKFYIPSLPRQKEIAGILDKASELIEKRKEQLRELDALAESVFQDMFGDPVTNEKGWEKKRWDNLFYTRLGKMLDKKKQIKTDQLLSYLGNSNVLWNSFDLENLNQMTFTQKEIDALSLQKDDLLICEGGEAGRCAVWMKDHSLILFQKAIHRARIIDRNIVNVIYVQRFLFEFKAKGGLNKYLSKSTIEHLTGEKLKSVEILLPPLSLQQQFAAIIEKIESQKAKVKEALKESEDLFERLMQDLFNPDQD